ncbi:LuxR C-terminal-related transcriptional regulator [Gordonia terrae]|uniref:ATP-binding protein n=1 Tax=Gordonia hongkongensis TaxID=1701090 RepID=UPI0022B5A0D5|nr:LuxR C-terminal-related transcriptional regulator [Gordonia terrae]
MTVTGSGGIGKTRLALHAAHRLRRSFPEGVYFIPLADVAEPSAQAVFHLVANALDARDISESTDQKVYARIGERRILLILDGCQDVHSAAGHVAEQILRHCGRAVVLATSRRRLATHGESLLPLGPLENVTFDPERATPAAVGTVPAVALFVDRARAASPAFALTADNAADVAEVCLLVDGIPLGIELAAARIRAFSPRQVRKQVTDSLVSRQSPPPTDLDVLSSVIQSSFDMCSPEERQLWSLMSVFSGSPSLDDIQAVCTQFTGDFEQTIAGLTDQSVLTAELGPVETRWRMLSPFRSFGRAQLGDGADEAVARHASWYHNRALSAAEAWLSPGQPEVYARLRSSYTELRSAFRHLVSTARADNRPPGRAVEMANALRMFWLMSGRLDEGQDWLASALTDVPLDSTDPRIAEGRAGHAYLDVMSGNVAAAEPISSIPELSPQVRALKGVVAAMAALVTGEYAEADELALRYDTSALAADDTLHRELAFIRCQAAALSGRVDAAITLCRRHRAQEERGGDAWGAGYFLALEAGFLVTEGDLAGADRAAQEALSLSERFVDQHLMVIALLTLARIQYLRGSPTTSALLLGHARAKGVPYIFNAQRDELDQLSTALSARYGNEVVSGGSMTFHELRKAALRKPGQDDHTTTMGDALLSARETEVALLLADGLTNQEIAEKLVISKRTAEGHVQRVLTKSGVHRGQIASWLAARSV